MSQVTLAGQGFTQSHERAHAAALKLYGQDELAGSIFPARVTPSVSAPLALEIAEHWLRVAPACVERAIEAASTRLYGSDSWNVNPYRPLAYQPGIIFSLLEARVLVREEDIKGIGERSPVAASILRGLRDMFTAIKTGYWGLGRIALSGSAKGRPVMEAVQTRMFWNAERAVAFGCSGTDASVTTEEKWQAFKEGAIEGARDAAEVAGKAAGAIAATAGQVVGAAGKGFLSGLGLGNVVILGAGAFVAWKVI